jgi:hypothetical protein
MAADTIVDYEVVLANATIINANASSHPDLFWALKGGGNQFGSLKIFQNYEHLLTFIGIITKYKMKTVPLGQV